MLIGTRESQEINSKLVKFTVHKTTIHLGRFY